MTKPNSTIQFPAFPGTERKRHIELIKPYNSTVLQGTNFTLLLSILSYARRCDSEGEELFLSHILDRIKGMKTDKIGNRILTINNSDGTPPRILFSSHFDTVHNSQLVRQTPKLKGDYLFKEDGHPLGADDGAGIWLMFELIRNDVPGLYIFHYGEECGGIGSSYIADSTPDKLANIDLAIAFDRMGTDEIITHQYNEKCASDNLAITLAEELKMGHKPSSNGVFTDTYNYNRLVRECLNISVGYYDQHTKWECLDLLYLGKLRNALLNVDWNRVLGSVERSTSDVGESFDDYLAYMQSDYTADYPSYGDTRLNGTTPSMVELIESFPDVAEDLLEQAGYTKEEFKSYIQVVYGLNV